MRSSRVEGHFAKGVRSMMNALLLTLLSVVSAVPTSPRLGGPGGGYRPVIQVWLSGEGYYHRGDRARVSFDTETDAFVTIFRIDTDGQVRVLFPHDPWQDNYVYGKKRYEVFDPHSSRGRHSFVVDEYPGQGYILAVASSDPFDYRAFTRKGRWDYEAIAYHGRVTGDPYIAFEKLVYQILPVAYDDYTLDVYPYHVERRYAYPRFLCYDCHSHVAFTYWNPYKHSCVRFRLVIHDDPYYYPARVYAGTRVVYKRPVRYEPRYIFKDRVASEPYITRERGRPAEREGRRPVLDRGATSRDVGGVGRIPAVGTRTPVTTDGRDRVAPRRPVEHGSTRVTDGGSRRAKPIDTPRPVERPQQRRLDDQNREAERAAAQPPARPQLERRNRRQPTALPAPVREIRERSDARRPQSEQSAERAAAQRTPSSKQVAPARRSGPRASPSRPASKRRPEPKRKEKDPQR